MQAPHTIRSPRRAVVLDHLRAGLLVERSAGDGLNDDVLREDHRAPDHLAFPASILPLLREQVRDTAIQGRTAGYAHSPPCKGGVAAASIKSRASTEAPQTGWSLTRQCFKTHFET